MLDDLASAPDNQTQHLFSFPQRNLKCAFFGAVEKIPFSGSKGDTLLDWKSTPPYPPLTGGYKKAMRPRRAEGVLLFPAPLSRGDCLYGISLSRVFFNKPFSVAFDLRRLLRVRRI